MFPEDRRQACCQIFAFGVGDLAAFDERDGFVGFNGITEPLFKLRHGAKESDRNACDAVAARDNGSGDGDPPAQVAAADRFDRKMTGLDLALTENNRTALMVAVRRSRF